MALNCMFQQTHEESEVSGCTSEVRSPSALKFGRFRHFQECYNK